MRLQSLLALAALCAAAPAAAANYTVAPTGSDSANGVSAPFLSLQKAASVLGDGDTVTFKAGVYAGGCWVEGLRNVTLRGEAGAVIDGAGSTREDGMSFFGMQSLTIEGLTFRSHRGSGIACIQSQGLTLRNCVSSGNGLSGFLTANTSDVLVEGCTSFENGEHGLYLSQSGDRLTVRRNVFFNNAACGLQINAVQPESVPGDPAFDSLSDTCLVDGNEISGNGRLGGAGINLMGVWNSAILNNLLHDNLAGGIALFDDDAGESFGCKNNRIYHNTVLFAAGVGRFGVQTIAGSTDNQVFNNILACGAGPALETTVPVRSNYNALSGTFAVNDLDLATWRAESGNDLNSFAGIPELTADWRPAENSAALDSGLSLIDHDMLGTPRPAGAGPDLGCFEIGPPPPPPPPEIAWIFQDALAPGWSAGSYRARYSVPKARVSPEATIAISLTITGANGWLGLTGGNVAGSGRKLLKFRVFGGVRGRQPLRVRLLVDGKQKSLLDVKAYGGPPAAKTWKEYSIPLADLRATSGSITGVKFTAGNAQPTLLLDDIRIE